LHLPRKGPGKAERTLKILKEQPGEGKIMEDGVAEFDGML